MCAGVLPPSWGTMPSLLKMNISQNNLTGALPKKRSQVLASAIHLKSVLAAAYGDSSGSVVRPGCHAGPLPDQWANLAGLSTLDLQRNKLGGEAEIPANASPRRGIRLTPPAMLCRCALQDVLLT